MDNREELLKVMSEYKITKKEISKYLNVSIYTVQSWVRSNNSKAQRKITDNTLELLKLKLKLVHNVCNSL